MIDFSGNVHHSPHPTIPSTSSNSSCVKNFTRLKIDASKKWAAAVFSGLSRVVEGLSQGAPSPL
ncbi:hypothetical protein HanIR_Chr09g0420291 [Helianthus annuus]|nr:hypothetical protein HanIR_Chr09g0420291 [Helianthus annuus]